MGEGDMEREGSMGGRTGVGERYCLVVEGEGERCGLVWESGVETGGK